MAEMKPQLDLLHPAILKATAAAIDFERAAKRLAEAVKEFTVLATEVMEGDTDG